VKHTYNDSLLLRILAASSLLATAPIHAQNAAAAPAADTAAGGDTLEEVVVTASAGDKSKLNTSTSISSISTEQIQDFNATSSAELYRLIPGIQVAGTQGDGGNSNIGVRGLRTPTGGSPFVQVQEDGLPTVLFGDIQFGNNDYWTHPMPTDERIEAIRGGTASTLASQAIGAVLNHISYTGRNDGGYIELEKGLGYDFTKFNFRLGGNINDTTYYNLGGYYDVGRGIQNADYNVSNSYAVKGNITRELADNKGYIRLLFKAADTQEPSYNGCISSASLSGKTVGSLGPSQWCDARNQAPGYSALNGGALFADVSGNLARQPLNGILTHEHWVQMQTHYDYGNGLTIDDNARIARMGGQFNVQFYGAGAAAGAISGFNAPLTDVGLPALAQSIIYANGPKAGQLFTDPYVSSSASVHTNMDHMDHIANDLSGTFKTEMGAAKVDLKLGYLYYSQRIAEDWHSNSSLNEARGSTPAELAFVDGAIGTGNLLCVGGQCGFNGGWNQQFDATFTNNAPYLDLNFDIGKLNLDASVREEFFHGSGYAQGSSGHPLGYVAPTYAPDGVTVLDPGVPNGTGIDVVQTDPRTGKRVTTHVAQIYGYDNPVEAINFGERATNWSFGALYKLTPDLSVFGRASHGTRFNADRLTRSSPSYFAGNGELSAAGLANSAFPVKQYELGLKNRGELFGGHYTTELTAFYSTYSISSQEISATNCFNILGIGDGHTPTTCIIAGQYKDKGIELFATYKNHGWNVLLSTTYDNSTVAASQKSPYKRSPNIPDLTYTGEVGYDILSKAEIGLSFNGQSSIPGGDGNSYPSSMILGAFFKYRPMDNLQLGLNVYNLTDTFAAPGAAGFIGGTNNTLVNAGVAQGRAIKGTVKFSF
jgi:outer membrane receptor protein involved in Fe transport